MRTRSVPSLVLALAPLIAPAQGPRPAPSELARAVDSLAQEVLRAGLAPAFGVAVVMDGRTILARSYGHTDATARIAVDDRTLWYTASTSKVFAGFAAAILAEEGRLPFDAPISRLIPQARWHAAVRPESLTLARFLSHTHGLDGGVLVTNAAFTGAIPESRWPEILVYSAPTGSPDLVYSNFGYNVAGMAIDVVHREGWKDFLAKRVFAPAGMTSTVARVSGIPVARIAVPHRLLADGRFETARFEKTDATMNSAGGHLGTLSDFARFTIAQMDSGRLDGRQVYPAAAVARAQVMLGAQTRDAAKRFAYFTRAGWGAGWDLGDYDGEPMVSRFGSYASTRSHLSFLPRRRVGVVAMTNGRPAWNATDLVAAFAYDLEAGRPDARERATQRLRDLVAGLATMRTAVVSAESTRRARASRPLAHPVTTFAGTYRHDGLGTIEFRLEGDRLHYRWGVISGIADILDAAADTWRIELGMSGTPAAFRFDAAGSATAVVIAGSTFTRTRE
jgi:CubicO group peptidase (beta-lactamase class C family)